MESRATITGISEPEKSVHPQLFRVVLQLLVEIPGREPYAAVDTEGLPLETIQLLRVGMPVVVKVDVKDPQGVLIDRMATARALGWLHSEDGATDDASTRRPE